MTKSSSSLREVELPLFPQRKYQGFSLVEMAVVLVILGLLLGAVLVPLSAQLDQKRLLETRARLENAREALLGYAMAHGRFPCPAAAPSPGVTAVEAFATSPSAGNPVNGICAGFFNGFLPGVTLGLTPANSSGYILDGWDNPIRYAVANLSDDAYATYVFTKSAGMKNASGGAGMSWIATQNLLFVCASASGITAADCGPATNRLTNGAVFIVYSTGKNTATGSPGADETANLNNDSVFVSHAPTANTAPNGEFDDVMDWASYSTVFGRLVSAGQLP
ncbi:MAG: prepilin-type N-terminal cleavage/methylation domain-containing protein [Methylophilaceae bacterium]|nr:prepilin-type N-terminal cleavage/methylation domain-containing protein [Methylophilaceae bacterium]